MITNDKAGKKVWDKYWSDGDLPTIINPHEPGFRNYSNRLFHDYFSNVVFAQRQTQGLKILEVGCARSIWLPYFAKEFGFQIYGLDYSEIGCEQSRAILSNAGVKGEIICADFFEPPKELLNSFDVVISWGVVEHFENTIECLSAFSMFLKKDGIIITNIPNLNGLNGALLKNLNKPIFDTHVVLDLDTMINAHESAGFQVFSNDYFIPIDFSIPNLVGLNPQSPITILKNWLLNNLIRLGKLCWIIDENLISLKPGKLLSPYITVAGKKKCD